jgi:hypothetical protein
MADEEQLPEEEQAVFEFTTREEYINCACAALNTVEGLNPMTQIDTDRVKRIKRKCLRILDDLVGEMWDELYDNDEE